jgi:HD-like signal output (HDOD) protein
VEHLQQTAGPAAINENVVALAAKLLTDRSTLQACARIVLSDLGLTLRFLRIANSAMFNPGGKTVMNVTHAAALLGTDAMSQIIDTVPRNPMARPARELAVLSQITAVMARSLMGRIEPRFSEEAFIAGMFRNVGELSFAIEMPEEYQKVLAGSHANMVGLKASCLMQCHFDFDELAAELLHYWALYGAPVLAAHSTPEALFAQHGNPEADIALTASLAHWITVAYLRCEAAEREKMMRPCWPALTKLFQMREAQVESLCRACVDANAGLMERVQVTREGFRLKEWVPVAPEVLTVADAAAILPPGSSTKGLLETAISRGVDRAAWLPYHDPVVTLGSVAGDNWPQDGPSELPQLVNPRKPPYLLAFGQRQDVWIDFAKDNRFKESPLALTMKPAAFFLLPVVEGRRVRGCLYFDWAAKRDVAPETVMPALIALRDFMATNMLAA